MRNITAPRTVSFEEALRNLASRLTGVPASTLPRTQEGVVQFMAENLPPAIDVDGLAEAVTAEVTHQTFWKWCGLHGPVPRPG